MELYLLIAILLSHFSPINCTEAFLAANAFVANNTVRQTTTLSFQLFLNTQTVANNDYLQIVLPSGVSFKTGTATCSVTSITVSSCTIVSSSLAKLTLTNPQVTSSIQGSISNFINPDSVRTINNIEMDLYSSSGTLKVTTSSISLSNFSPALLIASVASSSTLVGDTNAQLKLTVTPQTVLKASGYVIITIPQYYNNSGSSYMIGSSPSCSATMSGTTVTVSTCNFLSSTMQMTVFYTLASGTDSTTAMLITVTSFQNPISTQAKSGFSVQTQDSNGYEIEQSNTLSLSGITQPASFQSYSVSLVDSNVVQTYTGIQFKLSLQVPLQQTCYVKVIFPSDFTITASQLTSSIGSGFFTTTNTNSSITLLSVDTVNLILTFEACQVQYGTQLTGIVTFSKIQNPQQIKTTGAIQILLAQDSAFSIMIAQVSSSNSLQIPSSALTSGVISSITITPVNSNVIQTATNYSVAFTTQSQLPTSSAVIIIQFPSSITLSSSGCSITGKSSNFGSTSISCSISGQKVTVTNPFATTATGGQSFTLSISYGTNPQSQFIAGTFTVSTYIQISGTNYLVDTGTSTAQLTPVGGLITKYQNIAVNNSITYQDSQTYSFYLTLAHSITSRGLLYIIIPPEVSISNQVLITSSCTRLDTLKSLSCSALNSSYIQVQFDSNGYASSSPLKIEMTGIQNPRTTQATSVFQFLSYDSSMHAIDVSSSASNLSASVSQASTMLSFSVTNVQKQNYQITNYTVSIVPNTPIFTNDMIQIQFPPEVTLPSLSQLVCVPIVTDTSNYVVSITCSLLDAYTIIALFGQIHGDLDSGNIISFTVENVRNPSSTQPSSPFSNIVIQTSTGYLISKYTNSDVVVINNSSNTINSFTMTQSNKQALVLSNYTITFQTVNPLPYSTSITIQAPDVITLSNSTTYCYVNLTISSKTSQQSGVCTISENIIQINNAFQVIGTGNSYTGTVIINFIASNPDQNYNQSLVLRTFTDSTNQYRINRISTGLFPSLQCNYPCLQCTLTNPNYCTSCYNQTSYPGILQPALSNGTSCVFQCSSGQTLNNTVFPQQCISCNTKCATCAQTGLPTDPTTCTSCSNSYPFFYQPTSTCLSGCNTTQYQCQNGKQCCDCQYPCQTCNGPSSCKTCIPGSANPLQLNDTCLSSCPTGYTQVGLQCVQCQSPCATCVSGQPSQCLTCNMNQGNQLLFGKSCVSQCPNGTTAVYSNTTQSLCTGCVTGCLQCDKTDNSLCLKCATGLSMLNSQCYQQCPFNYIKSADGSTCELRTYLLSYALTWFPYASASVGIFIINFFIWAFTCGKSQIFSNTIAFLGCMELTALMSQIYQAYQLSSDYRIILYASFGVYLALYAFNIFFVFYYCIRIQSYDINFIQWRQKYSKTTVLILLLSLIVNFKLFRLLYSRLLCIPGFSADILNKSGFTKKVQIYSFVVIFTVSLPLMLVDSLVLYYLEWGSQLYVTCIETAGIALFSSLLTLFDNCCMCSRISFFEELEAKRTKYRQRKLREQAKLKLLDQSKSMEPLVMADPEEIALKNVKRDNEERKEALKEILETMKGNKIGVSGIMSFMKDFEEDEDDQFLSGLGSQDNSRIQIQIRRANSDQGLFIYRPEELKGGDERETLSYPCSPKQYQRIHQQSLDKTFLDKRDRNYQLQEILPSKSKKIQVQNKQRVLSSTKKGRNKLQPITDDKFKFDNVYTDTYYPPPEPEPIPPKVFVEQIIQTDQHIHPLFMKHEFKRSEESLRDLGAIDDQQVENRKDEDEDQIEDLTSTYRRKKKRKLRGKTSSYYTEINEEDQEDQLSMVDQDTQREFLKTAYEEDDEDEERADYIERHQHRARRGQDRKRNNNDIYSTGGVIKRTQDSKDSNLQGIKQNQRGISDKQSRVSDKGQSSSGQQTQQQSRKSDGTKSGKRISDNSIKRKSDNTQKSTNSMQLKLIKVDGQDEQQSEADSRENDSERVDDDDDTEDEMTESQLHRQEVQDQVEKEYFNQRTFNINDIFGDFKKNWRGFIQNRKETLENQGYKDLKGRPVNKRGYVINEEIGYIVNKENLNLMFRVEELDEEGEIPMPYKLECFNFNPHEIMGYFDYDKETLRPTLLKNKQGQLVDKHLRPVSMSGFLIDEKENIVDNQGRIKFVKEQLNFFGDIPLLYNYKGKQFDIREIIGIFSQDQNSKQIVIQHDEFDKECPIDKLGRRVNSKGYLVDRIGNIINTQQKIVFFKSQLIEDEPPKFFPFSKFDMNCILGNMKRDTYGNIQFSRIEHGNNGLIRCFDQDDNQVNESGYFANDRGDIVDKYGDVVFLKETLHLDKNKRPTQIQKLFKLGLLEKKLIPDQSVSHKYFKEPNIFDDNLMSKQELENIVQQSMQNVSMSQKSILQSQQQLAQDQSMESFKKAMQDQDQIVDLEINNGVDNQSDNITALSQLIPLGSDPDQTHNNEGEEGEDYGEEQKIEQLFEQDEPPTKKSRKRKKSTVSNMLKKPRQGDKLMKAYHPSRPISSYLPNKYEQRAKTQIKDRIKQHESVNQPHYRPPMNQVSNTREQTTKIPHSLSGLGMNQTSTTDIFRKNAISALGFTEDMSGTMQGHLPHVKRNQFMAPYEQSDNSISALIENEDISGIMDRTPNPNMQMYYPSQTRSQSIFDEPSVQVQPHRRKNQIRDESIMEQVYDEEVSKYLDNSDDEGIFDVKYNQKRHKSNPRPSSHYRRHQPGYKMYERGQRLETDSNDSQHSKRGPVILRYTREKMRQQDSKLKDLENIYLQGQQQKNLRKTGASVMSRTGFSQKDKVFEQVRDRFQDTSKRNKSVNKYQMPSNNTSRHGFDY